MKFKFSPFLLSAVASVAAVVAGQSAHADSADATAYPTTVHRSLSQKADLSEIIDWFESIEGNLVEIDLYEKPPGATQFYRIDQFPVNQNTGPGYYDTPFSTTPTSPPKGVYYFYYANYTVSGPKFDSNIVSVTVAS